MFKTCSAWIAHERLIWVFDYGEIAFGCVQLLVEVEWRNLGIIYKKSTSIFGV
mgnify:CR=1 FL=1